MAYALLALGALLIVASVGAVSVPAAGLLSGALCLALGFGIWRADRPHGGSA